MPPGVKGPKGLSANEAWRKLGYSAAGAAAEGSQRFQQESLLRTQPLSSSGLFGLESPLTTSVRTKVSNTKTPLRSLTSQELKHERAGMGIEIGPNGRPREMQPTRKLYNIRAPSYSESLQKMRIGHQIALLKSTNPSTLHAELLAENGVSPSNISRATAKNRQNSESQFPRRVIQPRIFPRRSAASVASIYSASPSSSVFPSFSESPSSSALPTSRHQEPILFQQPPSSQPLSLAARSLLGGPLIASGSSLLGPQRFSLPSRQGLGLLALPLSSVASTSLSPLAPTPPASEPKKSIITQLKNATAKSASRAFILVKDTILEIYKGLRAELDEADLEPISEASNALTRYITQHTSPEILRTQIDPGIDCMENFKSKIEEMNTFTFAHKAGIRKDIIDEYFRRLTESIKFANSKFTYFIQTLSVNPNSEGGKRTRKHKRSKKSRKHRR